MKSKVVMIIVVATLLISCGKDNSKVDDSFSFSGNKMQTKLKLAENLVTFTTDSVGDLAQVPIYDSTHTLTYLKFYLMNDTKRELINLAVLHNLHPWVRYTLIISYYNNGSALLCLAILDQ